MRLPLSGADYFHHLVHRLIVRRGGPGNCGQVRVRMTAPPDAAAVATAWRRVGERLWTVGGTYRAGLRGAWFRVRGPALLTVDHGPCLTEIADLHWRAGLPDDGARARLGVAIGGAPGLVLTWDHRMCDARGAMALLAALPGFLADVVAADGAEDSAAGSPEKRGSIRGRSWLPRAREHAELPASLGERGSLARAALPHLGQRGRGDIWRPPGSVANVASPLVHAGMVLGAEATALATARQRATSGRLGETAFLIAGLAAALDDVRADSPGESGDFLFPLAIDARAGAAGADLDIDGLLENRHGFVFLRLPAGLARADLTQAAKVVTAGLRAWLADGAERKLAAALSFFPCVGERLAGAEIGGGCPGVAASCLVANTGMTAVPDALFGSTVIGVDHRVAVPAVPGLAVLFHRDARGLGWDVIAAGQVARALPPAALAARIRHHLVERILPGGAEKPVKTAAPPAPAAVGAP
jgi:hypothetical protein